MVAKTFDPPKSAPPNLGSQRRGRAGAGAGAPSFQSSFNDTLNDSLITDATTNATPAEEEAHHPRRSSLSSANAQSTAAFSALSNATPSYHRTLLARVNPPLCYSKKPLFETILQQHREKREQKLAQQMEQREIIKEILNSSSSPTLPDLTQKPSTTGVLTRPQISSIELNMSSGGMQSRQLPARPHTTGGR